MNSRRKTTRTFRCIRPTPWLFSAGFTIGCLLMVTFLNHDIIFSDDTERFLCVHGARCRNKEIPDSENIDFEEKYGDSEEAIPINRGPRVETERSKSEQKIESIDTFPFNNHSPKTTRHQENNWRQTGIDKKIEKNFQQAPFVEYANITRPSTSMLKWYTSYWQIVEDPKQEIFLYSAYFDDREGLEYHAVRIIAITEMELTDFVCLLWYKDAINPEKIKGERFVNGAAYPRHNKNFESCILSCNLTLPNVVPEYVSVLTPSTVQLTTYMKIKRPEKPTKPLEFGECVSVAYWKQDPYRIVEWMELQRLWGVQEVMVYNDSLDAASASVYQYYEKQGYVVFQQAPSAMPDEGEWTILLNMSPVINDCMYRNMYRYKYLVCTDIDEMIVPRNVSNYSSMIDYIIYQEISANRIAHSSQIKSFLFTNVYFFQDFGPVANKNSSLLTQKYLNHVEPSEYGYSSKSITDPRACIGLQNHLCWVPIPKFKHDIWNHDVSQDIGRSHHYKKCHFDTYLETPGVCKNMTSVYYTDHRMLSFGKILKKKVKKVLDELKLPYNW